MVTSHYRPLVHAAESTLLRSLIIQYWGNGNGCLSVAVNARAQFLPHWNF